MSNQENSKEICTPSNSSEETIQDTTRQTEIDENEWIMHQLIINPTPYGILVHKLRRNGGKGERGKGKGERENDDLRCAAKLVHRASRLLEICYVPPLSIVLSAW